ncbi:hypothetical protein [Campylobacter vicugnae]|uniref:hypothetical protein n=1 Tax=Campylobacter vicugnae TaxID=1660076 RepID=UPI002549F5D6|nr:hypothetical protein [Campylobacter ovis]MDL0105241.1 hypothetical protein [Campylobacter ovis]MDL0106660.1 hypothetical protein [Campylobacter ovis]
MATKAKQEEIDGVVSDAPEVEETSPKEIPSKDIAPKDIPPKVDSMVAEAKGVSTEALFKISNDSGKGTIKKKTMTVIRN